MAKVTITIEDIEIATPEQNLDINVEFDPPTIPMNEGTPAQNLAYQIIKAVNESTGGKVIELNGVKI